MIRWWLVLVIFFFGCSKKEEVSIVQGMAFSVIPYKVMIGQDISLSDRRVIASELDARLIRINDTFSNWKESSEINKFNDSPVGEWFSVSDDFWRLLIISRELYKDTGGYLDITLGNPINYYGFGEKQIDKIGEFGFRYLEFGEKQIKKTKQIRLNMSSIVEGFALEEMEKILISHGIKNFLLELGGEMLVSGRKFGKNWILALEKPTPETQEIQEIIKIKQDRIGLASSGGYRKYDKSTNLIHILDPKTGKSLSKQRVIVSILSTDMIKADAYATAMMAMSLSEATQLSSENKIATYITYFDEKTKKYKHFISDEWLKK